MMRSICALLLALAVVVSRVLSFAPKIQHSTSLQQRHETKNNRFTSSTLLRARINEKRRKQLGINDDEDEYDLYFALDQNTDPLITKLIAGSLIVVLIGLLVAGVVIPSLTDYGEGVCSPIQNAGRC